MSNGYKNAAEKLRLGGLDRDFKEVHVGKSVLLFLAERADETGYCFPGIKYIKDVLEMGESTVRKWLTFLENHEFIKKSRHGKGNGYQLLFPPFPAKKSPPQYGDDENQGATNERPNDKTPPQYSDQSKPSSLYYSDQENFDRYIREDSPLYYVGAILWHLIFINKERESSQESIKPTRGIADSFDAFCESARRGVCAALGVFKLPGSKKEGESRWLSAFEEAYETGFTADEFVSCFKEKSSDPQRRYPVTPENVVSALPHFRLRKNVPTVKPPHPPEENGAHIEPLPALSPEEWRAEEFERLKMLLDTGHRAYVLEEISYHGIDDQEFLTAKLGLTEAA